MSNSTPRIGLYGFREKDRNAIAVLMRNHPGIAELEEDPARMDIAIIDLDGPDHRELWSRSVREFDGPRIVVSIRERDYAEPAVFIRKPYHASRLIEAINAVETEAGRPASAAAAPQPQQNTNLGISDIRSAKVLDITRTTAIAQAEIDDAYPEATETSRSSATGEQTSSLTGLYRHLQARNRVADDDIPTLTSLAIPEAFDGHDLSSIDKGAEAGAGIETRTERTFSASLPMSEFADDDGELLDPTDELPVSEVFDRPPFELLETAEPDTPSPGVDVEKESESVDFAAGHYEPPAPVGMDIGSPAEPASDLYYEPDQCLQGVIRDARAKALAIGSPVEVCDLGEPLILCPSRNIVLTTLTDEHLESLSQMSIDPARVGISEVDDFMVDTIVSQSTGKPGSLDAFFWKIAVLCSRGRLPAGTVPDAPVMLEEGKHPVGVSAFSEGQAIVALWREGSETLVGTAAALNLPQRDVYSFYSAMDALELIHHPGKRRSGIFSRLFHHSAQG